MLFSDLPGINLAQCLLCDNLEQRPDKIAYLCAGESVSYRQLGDGAYRFAGLLQERGIGTGDRVLLALTDSPVFVAAFLGTLLTGAMVVAISTTLPPEHYRYILNDCTPKLILASPSAEQQECLPADSHSCLICGDRLSEWLPDRPATPRQPATVQFDDLAYMLYTSGSTGLPKGVPHRHADLLICAEQYAVKTIGLREDDLVFSPSKLFFAYGLGNSLAFPLYLGGTALLHPGKPLATELLALMEQHRPTVLCSVPTVFAQIIRSVATDRLQLPLRLCISAGEALPTALFEEWRRLTGLEILDGIGTTEAGHIFISNRPGQVVAGSAGEAVPGYEIRLVDDNDRLVPPGREGQLQVQGASVAPCYWNLPQKSAATMLPDGFLKTGDIFVEKGGYYFYRGRSDDMMKAGGQWISPQEVEEALRKHPAVADCAVAGYHVGGLERPAAHLILNTGFGSDPLLEQKLRKFLAAQLPVQMRPVRYFYPDELPRTSTGKLQRFKLRS